MTEQRTSTLLPHERLAAWEVAVELLLLIKKAEIKDTVLREQALRAAKSAALNVAEGAARSSPGDKRRAFSIARGEGSEAMGALYLAGALGDADPADVARGRLLASRLYGLLTGLIR